uniref:Uncharacterized protein n=1 Tax=Magallana gigas TaxID=29159 RepID=K1QI65_MAGGI
MLDIYFAVCMGEDEPNALAFQNLRRMCMGKSDCPTTKFCGQRGVSLHVVYHCIEDSNITCEEEEHTTNATQGVIKNLAYPSTDRSECTVRVKVPDDAYINVIIHDMERMASGEECDGGLRLRTALFCNFDETFPRKTVCSFSGNMTVFQACGDVEIYMTPSKEGFRFYISYIVTPKGEMPRDNYLDPISNQCPPGASIDKEVETFPIESYPESARDKHNEPRMNETKTLVTVLNGDATSSVDFTERAVFYVALIVAALSLTGLIVVTAVCIRRQRQLKYGGSIDIASLLSGRSSSLEVSALRPLPLTSSSTASRRHSYPANSHARLEDGYSIVADEIPYTAPSDELRSPAYAEVEDNLISNDVASSSDRTSERFPFGFPGTNLLSTERKSVENLYSDMNDKNVYHEITDDLIRTENVYVPSQLPSTTLSIFTGKKNLNKRGKHFPQDNFNQKMEISMPMLLCSSLVLVLISSVCSVPIDVARETENDHHLEEKRPKYMDTRDLYAFEKLVYLALKGLVEEGKVNPEVMTSEANEGFLDNQGENGESKEKAGPADKRGHLRICVRRSGSRYVPYPCFRS